MGLEEFENLSYARRAKYKRWMEMQKNKEQGDSDAAISRAERAGR